VADVRCPMCSKPNPEGADECGSCGARLKPVLPGGGEAAPSDQLLPPMPDWLSRLREPEDESPAPEQPAEAADEGEWLARLRSTDPDWSQAEWAQGPAAPPPADSTSESNPPARSAGSGAESPDWLSRLREASSEEAGPPEGELPPWLAEEQPASAPGPAPAVTPAADGEIPDWLARVRAKQAEEGGEVEGLDEFGQPLPDVFDLETTGWHSGLTGLLTTPGEIPPDDFLSTPGPSAPAWFEPEEPPAEPGPRTGRLSERIAPKPTAEEPQPPPAPAETERTTGSLAPKLPRGTDRLGPSGPRTEDLIPPARSTGRLGEQPAPPPPTPPFGIGDLEDETGLASLVPAAEEPPSQPVLSAPVLPTITASEAPPSIATGEPEWMKDLREPGPAAPAPIPHGPALTPGGGGGAEGADFDMDNVEVPDWLTEAGSIPSEAAVAADVRPDLAPATLPTWLEAMRPVETFRSVVEILPEEDQAVESAGPLAGLRGVLMAEPVVALPRISGIGSTRLNVSERQLAQAELLTKLVQDELRELSATGRVRRRLPLLRWAVAGLLLLAVALPIVLRLSVFALPSVEPLELAPLVDLVAGLPADRAALLVFDYEPANAGELEVVAGPLLEDLMSKGIPLATLSTRPTGPPLAERLLRQRGVAYDYQTGEDYVHLGYLSGGVPAIQLFSADPRAALLSGFAASLDLDGGSMAGWDSPVLEGVRSLSDFSMVVVVTAGAESARSWTEQASPWLAGRPLVMVLSAGVEPMIRPYYEALRPQVNGLLSGEPAAVAYELRNGKPGPAVERWNPFSLGVLVLEILLISGGVYGIGAWILLAARPRPRPKRP
jgi:hypothetical protein